MMNWQVPTWNLWVVVTDLQQMWRKEGAQIPRYPSNQAACHPSDFQLNCEIVIFSCLEVTRRPSDCQVHDPPSLLYLHCTLQWLGSPPGHLALALAIHPDWGEYFPNQEVPHSIEVPPLLLSLKSTLITCLWMQSIIFTHYAMSFHRFYHLGTCQVG